MRITKLLLVGAAVATLTACGGGATEEATKTDTPADGAMADGAMADGAMADGGATATPAAADFPEKKYTDYATLFDFLQKGEYKSFPVIEKAPHPSNGPHDDVKVFYNKTVADSLAAGNTEHPVGSMMVKEQYKPGMDKNYGWSVSIKTQDKGDNGNGWFWYEVTSTTDATKLFPAKPGNGVPECTGCHLINSTDTIRSTFPKS